MNSQTPKVYNVTSLPKRSGSKTADAVMLGDEWSKTTYANGKPDESHQAPNIARRRAVAATALSALVLSAGIAGYEGLSGGGDAKPVDTTVGHREYTARPSDNLFGIAQRAEPDGDANALVDSIELSIAARDHLKSVQDAENVIPGEQIPLPLDAHIGSKVPGQPEPGK